MHLKKTAAILAAAAFIAASACGCGNRDNNIKNESSAESEIMNSTETSDSAPKNNSQTANSVSAEKSESKKNDSKDLSVITMYVTGPESVVTYKNSDGTEKTDASLTPGTEVTVKKSDANGSSYTLVNIPGKNGEYYVLTAYLASDKDSVTKSFTANVGSSGAILYSQEGADSDELQTLYAGEEITVIAKTPGGSWRAISTTSGLIGYVKVTDIASDSIPSGSSQNVKTDSQTNLSSGDSYTTYITENIPGNNNENNSGSRSAVSSSNNNNDDEITYYTEEIELSPPLERSSEVTNINDDTFLGTALDKAESKAGGTWAAAYIDLQSGDMSVVNSSQMRAASLIKLYIMGAIYEKYDTYTEVNSGIDELLYSMITVSDNYAANELVSVLGSGDTDAGEKIVTSYAQSHGWSSTSMGRLLSEEAIYGDNYTSVADCADFMQSVYNGALPHSSDMLDLLSKQTITYKIPSGVPVPTANKTGELPDVQNDAAIVYADSPYVLCVMSEYVPAGLATSAIVELSSDVYSNVSN